jgi:hypothetical protein
MSKSSDKRAAKPLLVALGVAGVFVAGITVGMLFSDRGDAGVRPDATATHGAGQSASAPRVTFDGAGDAVGGESDAGAEAVSAPDKSEFGTSAGPGGPGGSVAPPPPPPPLIPAEALADVERMDRERDRRGPDADTGDGKVTTLIYDFDTDEERQAWEAKFKTRWETRLQREIDIKVRQLREKIGLTAPQEGDLRELLGDELTERSRLVGLLTAKKISRSDFDSAVRTNVNGARARLKETLTPQQLVAYGELKPREQVLRDETK